MTRLMKVFVRAVCIGLYSVNLWCASTAINTNRILLEIDRASERSIFFHVGIPDAYVPAESGNVQQNNMKKFYLKNETPETATSRVIMLYDLSKKNMDPQQTCMSYRANIEKEREQFAGLGNGTLWPEIYPDLQKYVMYCAYTENNQRIALGMVSFGGNQGAGSLIRFAVASPHETDENLKTRIQLWFFKYLSFNHRALSNR